MLNRRLAVLGLAPVLLLAAFAAAGEKVLFERTSAYNTVVVTEDDSGLRTLWFERGGARQSVIKVGDPDHIELPYARAMPVGLALVERPQRVLIVGLGGATIPNLLHRHYPRMAIDVVDIDPVVVDAARQFFGFREDATMRAYVADGRRFIEECRNPYDVIFLDAFGSENIPYHLATREFLTSVKAAIAPGGVAVGNIWSRSSNPLHDSMIRTYLDVFAELYLLEVRGAGNEILLAVADKRQVDRAELERRARGLSMAAGFRFDLGDAVAFSFRRVERDDLRGRVLTDADAPRSDE